MSNVKIPLSIIHEGVYCRKVVQNNEIIKDYIFVQGSEHTYSGAREMRLRSFSQNGMVRNSDSAMSSMLRSDQVTCHHYHEDNKTTLTSKG